VRSLRVGCETTTWREQIPPIGLLLRRLTGSWTALFISFAPTRRLPGAITSLVKELGMQFF
jgi:hypothetical protein